MDDELLEHLVRKAQSGDQDALAKILRRFRPLIRNRLYNVSPQDRDDLEQALVEKVIGAVRRANIDDE